MVKFVETKNIFRWLVYVEGGERESDDRCNKVITQNKNILINKIIINNKLLQMAAFAQ